MPELEHGRDANLSKKLLKLANKRLMDLLAVREHSEQELRMKLQSHLQRALTTVAPETPDDLETMVITAIDTAIQRAYQQRWLAVPEVLSAQTAEKLHRKNKGIEYINHYLAAKGLPPVPQENELELEKALSLVKNKYSDFSASSPEERQKMQGRVARFLASKGFDSEIVRKVIYEKFGD